MFLNVNSILIGLVLVVVNIDQVRCQGVNLGLLHWCDPLCLCHDETQEKLKCFEEAEIYSLLDIDPRQVQRLSQSGFLISEKLMWCTETCLCHKSSHKEFKCTDRVQLGDFINERAPFLNPYLEPEVEVFDVRDIVDKEEEEQQALSEAEREKKERHDRRKNRKHRKNRKKNHHENKEELQEEETEPDSENIPLTLTSPSPPSGIMTTESDNPIVLSANILPQASTGRGLPSRSPDTETDQTPELEVPIERKTVAGEVSNNLEKLRQNMEEIKGDVELNQHILLITVAVAAVAMIGVLILAIYSCCVRRSSSKSFSKGGNSSTLHHQENNVTKVNMDEAW